jgi:lambda repressor-like predicted transcriptional regulator
MTTLIPPTIHGIRVVSVGNLEYAGVPLDGDVLVQPTFTLVRTRQGAIHRLIGRDGLVLEAPLNNQEWSHAAALLGVETRPRPEGRVLTPEREAMAASLRRAGYGIAAISDVFGVSPRTLHAILRRQGVETTRGRRLLTVAQETEVHRLRNQGWTQTAIGAHFSISRDTVRLTLSRPTPTE